MSIRAVLTVSIVAALLLSGLGGATVAELGIDTESGADDVESVPDPDTNTSASNGTIQVTSSAERSAPPDRATVRFAVVATGDSADDARSRVAENASSVRAALEETGVADDDVRTAYYDISVVYGENRSDIEGYRAVHAFAVDIESDADELGNQTGSVVDTVVQNGADRIEGVEFGLTEETRSDLRQEALERAMTSADRDAETLAAASGLTITGVQSVSTSDDGVRPVEVAYQEDAAAATVIEPGQVTVSATVSVTYRTG